MGVYKGQYLLRDLHVSLNALSPNDKVMLLVEGSISGGVMEVNLGELVRPGANVFYYMLKGAVIQADGTMGDLTTLTDPGYTDPADTTAVEVLVVVDPKDYRYDGE